MLQLDKMVDILKVAQENVISKNLIREGCIMCSELPKLAPNLQLLEKYTGLELESVVEALYKQLNELQGMASKDGGARE
ncbi:hypothetical protein AX14_005141 [Amanita brunnescens Koide BX004]|nr:hypothetical protein AX14_005141 [Amanita brunnescens Koide BX004]